MCAGLNNHSTLHPTPSFLVECVRTCDACPRIAPMRSLNVVMVKCPNTGRELSTGVEMDAATFKRLPDIRSQLMCPICKVDHVWSTRDAWLGNPAPSSPSFRG